MRTPGRLVQPLEEASFDAWIKLYKPDENTANAQVSYYLKGSLTALALDLTLRQAGHSLDEVMHTLWRDFGKTGQGLDEGAMRALVKDVTGIDVSRFLKQALHTTRELPLATLLGKFGIEHDASVDKKRVTDLGVRLANGNEARIATVYSGSAAEQAGLAGGDIIIAVDGIKTTAANLDKLTSQRAIGARIKVHAFRRDELMAFDVRLQAADPDLCKLSIKKLLSPDMRRRMEHWLTGTTR
jgi:predicted metalloprotease with PDZ domain